MKPRLFIGSSREGIRILQYVEKELGDIVECYTWINENVFQPNKGILDTLIKQAKLSDFALLIATKDDIVKNTLRGTEKTSARDNVIFEHGLFLGATSVDRAFLLAEEGIDLPSDFNGVATLDFSENIGTHNHIDERCKQLIENIKKASSKSELGFVPSTALAMGYFNSFIKRVSEELGKNGKIIYKDKEIAVKSFKLNVILPEAIDDDGVNNFKIKYNKTHGLEQASTAVLPDSGGRGYPFHFRIDPPEQNFEQPLDLHVFDIPTTIDTILEAIKLYFPSSYVGTDEDREHIERRELINFANVVRHYVNKNAWTRDNVEVLEKVKA